MIQTTIPSYNFQSLEEAAHVLGAHCQYNEYRSLRELRVDSDGTLYASGNAYPISDLALEPIARAVRYPIRNLSLLSVERIAGDLNYLFDRADEKSGVVIRFWDGAVYDVRRRPKLDLPMDHSLFASRLAEEVPRVLDHENHTISFSGGTLRICTRSRGDDLEPVPGDYNSVGLELLNSDHQVYRTGVTYHIYRHSCSNSAIGIAGRFFKNPHPQDLASISVTANRMLDDQVYLRQAYRMLSQQPLTEFTYQLIDQSLRSQVGTRRTMDILDPYTTRVEETIMQGARQRVVDRRVLDANAAQSQTEYDLFNHVTWRAKDYDGELSQKIQRAAGALVSNYISALRLGSEN